MDFSHYPVLEYLTIDGSLGICDMNFNVSVPELKTLRISLDPDFNQFEPCNFLINAPKLEKLDINEGFFLRIIPLRIQNLWSKPILVSLP
jgi:hypothetical protein